MYFFSRSSVHPHWMFAHLWFLSWFMTDLWRLHLGPPTCIHFFCPIDPQMHVVTCLKSCSATLASVSSLPRSWSPGQLQLSKSSQVCATLFLRNAQRVHQNGQGSHSTSCSQHRCKTHLDKWGSGIATTKSIPGLNCLVWHAVGSGPCKFAPGLVPFLLWAPCLQAYAYRVSSVQV